MLKYLGGLGMLVLFAGGLYFYSSGMKSSAELDRIVALGFERAGQVVTTHLAVTDLMVKADPPRLDGSGPVDWIKWINTRIEVRDAQGALMPWQRVGMTRLITTHEAGISDQFMEFELQPGAIYTITYLPNVDAGLRYRGQFTVPGGTPPESQRVALNPL